VLQVTLIYGLSDRQHEANYLHFLTQNCVLRYFRFVRFTVSDGSGSKEMKKGEDERLQFEQLISDLSARFVRVSGEEVGPEIRNAIAEIVRFFDFDRGEFGEFAEDNKTAVLLQSYTLPGIEPFPEKITNDLLPWYTEMLRRGQVVRIERPEDLPKEAIGRGNMSEGWV
jgi:hypothetical protein